MKASIRFKLLPIIVVGISVLTAGFYAVSSRAQQATLEDTALNGIRSAKRTFYDLERNDVKMLKGAITQFMTNQRFKDIFLENDREKLYDYCQDLFAQNKKLGMTHLYFHRKDGTVFVRCHNASKYDDKVTRNTFYLSSRTKDWGTGIELGKTAFALRVVHPYYDRGELIGYIEFGEEIDHFVEIMKDQTGNEYAVVVKKKYIDPEKWASVRAAKGLRNNYDDQDNYVIIDTTMQDANLFKEHAFDRAKLESVSDDGNMFNIFHLAEKTFVGGGFSLYDAASQKVGAVVTIEDITSIEQSYRDAARDIFTITILAAVLICAIMIFVVTKVIIKPLDKVVEATTRVAGGDFSATIDVNSDDEIGSLAKMIEGFKQIMVSTARELKEARSR